MVDSVVVSNNKGSIILGQLILITLLSVFFVFMLDFLLTINTKSKFQVVADNLSYAGVLNVSEKESKKLLKPIIDEKKANQAIEENYNKFIENIIGSKYFYEPRLSVEYNNGVSQAEYKNGTYDISTVTITIEVKLKNTIFIKEGTVMRVRGKSLVRFEDLNIEEISKISNNGPGLNKYKEKDFWNLLCFENR